MWEAVPCRGTHSRALCAELEAAVARPALSRWLKVVLF